MLLNNTKSFEYDLPSGMASIVLDLDFVLSLGLKLSDVISIAPKTSIPQIDCPSRILLTHYTLILPVVEHGITCTEVVSNGNQVNVVFLPAFPLSSSVSFPSSWL